MILILAVTLILGGALVLIVGAMRESSFVLDGRHRTLVAGLCLVVAGVFVFGVGLERLVDDQFDFCHDMGGQGDQNGFDVSCRFTFVGTDD